MPAVRERVDRFNRNYGWTGLDKRVEYNPRTKANAGYVSANLSPTSMALGAAVGAPLGSGMVMGALMNEVGLPDPLGVRIGLGYDDDPAPQGNGMGNSRGAGAKTAPGATPTTTAPATAPIPNTGVQDLFGLTQPKPIPTPKTPRQIRKSNVVLGAPVLNELGNYLR